MIRLVRKLVAVATVAVIAAAAPAASAQGGGQDPASVLGGVLGGKLGGQMGELLGGDKAKKAKKKKARRRKRRAAAAEVASQVRVDAAARNTSFAPTGDRVMLEQIVGMARGTEQEIAGLRAAVTAGLDAFDRGPGRNNVAAALTYLMVICYDIGYGVEVPPDRFALASSAVDAALSAEPQFAAMSARDKQVLYETGVITASAFLFARSEAERQKDTKAAEEARAMARQVLTSFGVQAPAQ